MLAAVAVALAGPGSASAAPRSAAAASPAGTKVACATMPEAFVSAPWMPFAVAFDVIGRTSPSPNWAATFAGTIIRYRPSSAVVSVVEGGLGVLEMSCERCWAAPGCIGRNRP